MKTVVVLEKSLPYPTDGQGYPFTVSALKETTFWAAPTSYSDGSGTEGILFFTDHPTSGEMIDFYGTVVPSEDKAPVSDDAWLVPGHIGNKSVGHFHVWMTREKPTQS